MKTLIYDGLKSHHLDLFITPEQWADVGDVAGTLGCNRSVLVREAISEYLVKHAKTELRGSRAAESK